MDGAPNDRMLTLLSEGSAICNDAGRTDLAHALAIATARLRRPSTVVCIVGEYKQGKSEVVNALAGRPVCPVDDDIATATITVIAHGDAPAAFVHRTEGGERTVDPVEIADIAALVTETEDGSAPSGIDMVEVVMPSEALADGLALVDTPGVNALRHGDDRAVLDFLPYADGLILVTDASAELSPPELRFLDAARERCPAVLVALTKIDVYPEWRRIAELDTRHLAELGLADRLVAVSSALESSGEADDGLTGESGFMALRSAIDEHVVDPARRLGWSRAGDDLANALDRLRAAESARLDALDDPAAARQRLEELEAARAGVAQMRQASAKWLAALNDGMTDIRSQVDYRLRSSMRSRLQETDRRLTESRPDVVWEDLCEELRTALAEDAEGIFTVIREGTAEVAGRIGEMIAEETAGWDQGGAAAPRVEEIWAAQERELRSQGGNVLSGGLSVLRGGYSGMLMLGMLGQLAGIAALGAVTLGAGALFGVKQFRDERKRRTDQRRQEARTVLRGFLEEVQFELSARSQRALQEAHRSLRDEFGDRIQRLASEYATTAARLEDALSADADRRTELRAESIRRLEAIEALAGRLQRERPAS
jgi:hypothetical protein